MALPKQYQLRQSWLADISERSLDPDFVRAVQSRSDAALDAFVRRPHAGVIEFPLFSAEHCQALLRELHVFEHWCQHHQAAPTRPNSMNNHGVVLAEICYRAT